MSYGLCADHFTHSDTAPITVRVAATIASSFCLRLAFLQRFPYHQNITKICKVLMDYGGIPAFQKPIIPYKSTTYDLISWLAQFSLVVGLHLRRLMLYPTELRAEIVDGAVLSCQLQP